MLQTQLQHPPACMLVSAKQALALMLAGESPRGLMWGQNSAAFAQLVPVSTSFQSAWWRRSPFTDIHLLPFTCAQVFILQVPMMYQMTMVSFFPASQMSKVRGTWERKPGVCSERGGLSSSEVPSTVQYVE